jgi:hypothetical protein
MTPAKILASRGASVGWFVELSVRDLAAGSERQMITEVDTYGDLAGRDAYGKEVGELLGRNDRPWAGHHERDGNLTLVRIGAPTTAEIATAGCRKARTLLWCIEPRVELRRGYDERSLAKATSDATTSWPKAGSSTNSRSGSTVVSRYGRGSWSG